MKVEESFYPCSANKNAEQLLSDCEADLRLYFRIYREKVRFSPMRPL